MKPPVPKWWLDLGLMAAAFVVLPFVTTFDDLLTVIGTRLGIAAPAI